MLVTINISFYGAQTFGGHTPGGGTEWPPSPARLFSALVAGAGSKRTDAQEEALASLQSAPAPLIIAARKLTPSARLPHFVSRGTSSDQWASSDRKPVSVPRNKLVKLLGSRLTSEASMEIADGRTGGGGEAPAFGDSVVVTDGVDYIVELPDRNGSDAVDALNAAADRVGYLGRSTDTATISVQVLPDDGSNGGAHAHATALAATTHRVAWVRSGGRGSVTTRGWYPGLLSALDAVHRGETTGSRLPHPAYLTPQWGYRIAVDVPAETASLVAHLDTPLTGHNIGRLMERMPAHATVLVAPGRDTLYASASHVYTSGTVDDVGDRIDDITSTLATFDHGLDFDWDDVLPRLAARYTGESNRWFSAVPVSCPGPAKYAAAKVALDIGRRTGVAPELLQVTAVPPSGPGSKVHPAAPGSRLWDITVASPQPLSGPLTAGDTCTGVLAHD